MDIFLSPGNPFRPVPRAEFYPDPDDNEDPFSRWDGGPFLTYPHRKNILHMIPLNLRHGNHPDNGTIPFTEMYNPTPRHLQHRIFTTWFFVGLVAEFLGANRQDDPDRAGANPAAETILVGIYKSCVTSDSEPQAGTTSSPSVSHPNIAELADRSEGQGGRSKKRYLTAEIIPRLLDAIISTINLLPEGSSRQKRIAYLSKCLRLTAYYVRTFLVPKITDKEGPFDPFLLPAINGLGELLSTHLFYSISITKSFGEGIVDSLNVAYSWKGNCFWTGGV